MTTMKSTTSCLNTRPSSLQYRCRLTSTRYACCSRKASFSVSNQMSPYGVRWTLHSANRDTNTHLFLHQVLRNYLEKGLLEEAVFFAASYQDLVYFAHALEILLHAVLEDEADAGLGDALYARKGSGSVLQKERSASSLLADVAEEEDEEHNHSVNGRESSTALDDGVKANGKHLDLPRDPQSAKTRSLTHRHQAYVSNTTPILPLVVEFLDHFPEALEVVVGCAVERRKSHVGISFRRCWCSPSAVPEMHSSRSASHCRNVSSRATQFGAARSFDCSYHRATQVGRAEGRLVYMSRFVAILASIDPAGGALKLAVDEAGIFSDGKA